MIADCQTSEIGDVRVDFFFPPGVYLIGFAKTNTRNIPEAQMYGNIEAWEISSSSTKEILWMLLQLRFQLHWCGLLQFGAASLRKVENTSMLQLLPFKDAAN